MDIQRKEAPKPEERLSPAISQERAYHLLQTKPSDRTQADVEDLAGFLKTLPGCMSVFGQEAAQILCRHLGYEYKQGGSAVMREGHVTTSMYVVLEGHCERYAQLEESKPEMKPQPVRVLRRRSSTDPGSQYSFRRQYLTSSGDSGSVVDGEPTNPGDHIGWIEAGDPFSELALLDAQSPAPYSVIAAAPGVHLLTLERSAYRYLLGQVGLVAGAASAINSLLSALCLRPLKGSPEHRTEDDIQLLTVLLRKIDAFRALPEDLCLHLAEGMVHVRAPAGATIIEEGDPGDCMYVLLSGTVEVRQQPEPENLLDFDSDDEDHRSLISAVTNHTKLIKRASQASIRVGVAGSSHAGGRRSSHKEHKFESAAEKNAIISMKDEEADKAGLVEHNGNYWINKFMEGAKKAIPAQETHSGHGQSEMTPLAAIAAAKWRWMTFEEREKERKKKEAIEWEKKRMKEELVKEAGVYHDVLGMGAAKNVNKWRQQALAARKADEEMLQMMETNPGELLSPGSTSKEAANMEGDVLSFNAKEGMEEQPNLEGADAQTTPEDGAVDAVQKKARARARWGKSTMAVGFMVKAKALIDPNRRMLDRLAKQNPAQLHEFLAEELTRRADVNDVLTTVSKAMMRKGAPRKLSINNSRKLYEAITGTINRGASDRGFQRLHGHDNRSLRSLRLSQGSVGSGDFETMTQRSLESDIDDHPDLSDVMDGDTDNLAELASPKTPGAKPKHHATTLTRDMLMQAEVPLVGVDTEGKPIKRLLGEDTEALFGPLVRCLHAGASFGELALLQKSASRTASILVPPSKSTSDGTAEGEAVSGKPLAFDGVELIRVTRESYDRTVNHLMSKQLKEMLDFLSQVEPFRGLPKQHLSSLAVFVRPVAYDRGALVVSEGEIAGRLYIVQEGEVRVMCEYDQGQGDRQTLASAPKKKLPAARGSDGPPTAAKMRELGRSSSTRLSDPLADSNAPGRLLSSRRRSDAVGRWGGTGGLSGAGIVVHGGGEVSHISKLAPLAVLGPKQAFGQELLGSSSHSPQAEDEFQPEFYGSTIVVTSINAKLLEISSRDLRRFGHKVVEAVQHYNRLRQQWHKDRLESCKSATDAAAMAIERLGDPDLLPAELAPENPPQNGLGPSKLISASAMMARRRSDAGLDGLDRARRWSSHLPPQVSRNLPPPPEAQVHLPKLSRSFSHSATVPGPRAPPMHQAMPLSRVHSTNNRMHNPMPINPGSGSLGLSHRRASTGDGHLDHQKPLDPITEAYSEMGSRVSTPGQPVGMQTKPQLKLPAVATRPSSGQRQPSGSGPLSMPPIGVLSSPPMPGSGSGGYSTSPRSGSPGVEASFSSPWSPAGSATPPGAEGSFSGGSSDSATGRDSARRGASHRGKLSHGRAPLAGANIFSKLAGGDCGMTQPPVGMSVVGTGAQG